MCDHCQELEKELQGKALLNKEFFHSLLYDAGLIKKADPGKPTFKPNKNLGEGKASDRNLEFRQALLTLLEDTVYKPMNGLLKSDKSVNDKITDMDGFIDDYISQGQDLVKEYLISAYQNSAEEATEKLLAAAKKQNAKYKPKLPKEPKKLSQLIAMAQRNIEDYGLTLRGRLRSNIENQAWMSNYAKP